MSGYTGLSAQIAIGEETTPGTAVALTRFFEFTDESLKFSQEKIKSKGLRAGRNHANTWVYGRKSVEGDVTFEVQPNGMGILPKYLIGGTPVTTTPEAATAYLHTTKEGSLDGKSLTVQVGRPNTAGTIDPYTYSGCKVASWELSMAAPDGVAMLKLSLDGMDETTATGLASASYPSTNVMIPFSDSNCSITIGGTSYNVKQITLSGTNSLKTDRYKIGSASKLEQIANTDYRDYSGTIDLESYAGTTAYNLFKNGTEAAIVCTFKGAVITGSARYMFRVTLPRVIFNGETPNAGGADILDHSLPFEVLHTTDTDTACKMEVQNSDSAA